MQSNTQKLSVTGLLVALGLLLPAFTAHLFALPGVVLLPMHIPVLLCGFLCGPRYGALCGLVTPVLSSLLTGMPPAFPMLPIMACQLVVMGLLGGLFTTRLRLPLYPALLLTMAGGWLTYGLVFSLLLLPTGGNLRALSLPAALLQGLPGMALQLLLIPGILLALKNYRRGGREARKTPEEPAPDPAFAEAMALLEEGQVTCVVMQRGEIVHKAAGPGVRPLLQLYDTAPELLRDAVVVDKIIGKAAAMILVLGGAQRAYGDTMSAAACDCLRAHGIEATYRRWVDVIANRARDGICPLERSVLEIDDPEEALLRIRETIQELMSKAM